MCAHGFVVNDKARTGEHLIFKFFSNSFTALVTLGDLDALDLCRELDDVILQEHVDDHGNKRHGKKDRSGFVTQHQILICVEHKLDEVKRVGDIESELAFENIHHERKEHKGNADEDPCRHYS